MKIYQTSSYDRVTMTGTENKTTEVKSGQTKKKYENVVKNYKQKHPESAPHVDTQLRAGRRHIQNCGAENVSRSDMTMEEYKVFFKNLMDKIPFDSSQQNDTEIWSITEEGWEQMKNDPDYEAWVLGYTVENRSVHFPFLASRMCIEKFGASIEEHLGQGFPKDDPTAEKSERKEESWWYKRHKRMKQLIREQNAIALSKSRYLNEIQQQERLESEMQSRWYRQQSQGSNINQTGSNTDTTATAAGNMVWAKKAFACYLHGDMLK